MKIQIQIFLALLHEEVASERLARAIYKVYDLLPVPFTLLRELLKVFLNICQPELKHPYFEEQLVIFGQGAQKVTHQRPCLLHLDFMRVNGRQVEGPPNFIPITYFVRDTATPDHLFEEYNDGERRPCDEHGTIKLRLSNIVARPVFLDYLPLLNECD